MQSSAVDTTIASRPKKMWGVKGVMRIISARRAGSWQPSELSSGAHVHRRMFLVGANHLPIFREVRDSYLAREKRPASTTIAISALAREGPLREVEAVAVLPPARARLKSRSGTRRPG